MSYPDTDEGYDFDDEGGLYVNFSDDDAATEARDPEPLPAGKYFCTLTDVELKESKSADNHGKPMYNLVFTVVEDKAGGKYVNRKIFTNACLWPGALFTITWIMKALNLPVSGGRMRIPKPDELIDKQFVVAGILKGETTDKNDPAKKYPPRYEVKGIFAAEKWKDVAKVGTATSKGSSLLS